MNERIKKLNREIDELTEWMNKHIALQVDFPLSEKSKTLIQKNLLVGTGNFGATITGDTWLEVKIQDKIYWLASQEI